MLHPTVRQEDQDSQEASDIAPEGNPASPATLDHLLVEAAIQCPEADALVGDFGSLTYADLLIRAQNIAVVLKRKGIGPGHFVGVAMEQTPVTITAIAGVILAGAAYVPLGRHRWHAAALRQVRASGVSIVLCDGCLQASTVKELSAAWKTLGTLLDASRMEQETMPSSSETKMTSVAPDGTAAVFFSSDVDREPKAVRVSHRRVSRLCTAQGASTGLMDFGAGETFLLQPAAPDRAGLQGGLFELWGGLLHGAALALAPELPIAPPAFAEWVRRFGVSVLCLPVARVHEYVDHAPEIFARLRHLIIESDGRSGTISPQRVEWLLRNHPDLQIVNTYSTPKLAGYATAYRVPALYTAQSALPIGAPMEGLQASILDRAGQAVRTGEIGELALSGEDVCEGGLCLTGERARLRADGLLELHGHAEPLLVSAANPHGFAAEDVETMLAGQLKVRDAVVIQDQDRHGNEQLVAFVAIKGDQQEAGVQMQIEQALKLALPPTAMPSALRYVKELPKDAQGAVDRMALQQLWKEENKQPARHERASERYHEKILEQVRSLWLRLLRRSSVGYEEDFFAAGGTRVQMIRMHAELNRKFPGAITMGELSVLTTIRKIYEHLMTDPERAGRGLIKRA